MQANRKTFFKVNWNALYCFLVIVLFSFFTTGCTSSSDDESSGDGPAGLAYTGATTPATIDESNARPIMADAFFAGGIGSSIGDVISAQKTTDQESKHLSIISIMHAFDLFAGRIILAQNPPLVSAIDPGGGTIQGNCGGEASYTIDIGVGIFSGDINFDDYCNDGITLSGPAWFSGTFDIGSAEILTILVSFDSLHFLSGDEAFTMDGEISIDYTGTPVVTSINLLMRKDAANKVYWYNDYVIETNDYVGYIEFVISGEFYDPDHGYVVISTPMTFRMDDADNWPNDGTLLAEGSDSTKARLIAESETTCRVRADTTGDGDYDYESDPIPWEDL